MQRATIKVEPDTLKRLKEYQRELKVDTINNTILLMLGWSKSFNSNFLVSQVELSERLTKVESWQKSDSQHLIRFSNAVISNSDKHDKLEMLCKMLAIEIASLRKKIEKIEGKLNE